jgi:hypothetical protein
MMEHKTKSEMSQVSHQQHIILQDSWNLYAHLPHDTNWMLDSYKNILRFNTIEESIALFETLPDSMVKNCMLFLMKNDIKPIWEDPLNRNGGCFSFKVSNKDVVKAWKYLCYSIIGRTISKNKTLLNGVNGATISPKKNFCIIKIWVKDCNTINTKFIQAVPGLDKTGVIFKKHKPEY